MIDTGVILVISHWLRDSSVHCTLLTAHGAHGSPCHPSQDARIITDLARTLPVPAPNCPRLARTNFYQAPWHRISSSHLSNCLSTYLHRYRIDQGQLEPLLSLPYRFDHVQQQTNFKRGKRNEMALHCFGRTSALRLTNDLSCLCPSSSGRLFLSNHNRDENVQSPRVQASCCSSKAPSFHVSQTLALLQPTANFRKAGVVLHRYPRYFR